MLPLHAVWIQCVAYTGHANSGRQVAAITLNNAVTGTRLYRPKLLIRVLFPKKLAYKFVFARTTLVCACDGLRPQRGLKYRRGQQVLNSPELRRGQARQLLRKSQHVVYCTLMTVSIKVALRRLVLQPHATGAPLARS